ATIAALPTTSTNGISGSWSPAINNTATTEYTFTPDEGQCATSVNITIDINDKIIPTFSAIGPLCMNSAPPILSLTSNNGITGTWDPPTINTTEAGIAEYTFTPTNGLCATKAILHIESVMLIAPVASVTTKPDCILTTGIIEVTSPLGTNYEYSLDGLTFQGSPIFTSLLPGTYGVRVKEKANGCISAPTFLTVTPALATPDPPVVIVTQPDCILKTGMIKVTAPMPAPGITYTLKGTIPIVSPISSSTGVFDQLTPGIYEVTTTNATGCTSVATSKTINISPATTDPLIVTETHINIDNDHTWGSIDLTVSGGTGPGTYLYSWSNGAITEDLSKLATGTYIVQVTDQNICNKASLTVQIMNETNLPPIATNDEFITSCSILRGDLLYTDNGNGIDHDPEGDSFSIEKTSITLLHGAMTINPDGSFVYQTEKGYIGDVNFQYRIFDKKKNYSSPATVTIHIISDLDHDGIADADDLDADGDGILNSNEGGLTTDTDGDGLPNYLDIDSDGDGIVDNFEAQSTADYIPPSNLDVNHNGVDDAYDPYQFAPEIQPVDTDGDGIPDFLDLDSDNDLVPDFIEGHDADFNGKPDHSAKGKDKDGDGLDDGYDTVVNDCNVLDNATGSNASMQDFDGDGLPDWRDDDDDDDKILTRYEDLNGDGDFSNDDIDFDGYPEYLDYGRECDLLIPDAFSPNGDNVHDYYQIYCINHYPNARLFIFDQMGNKVYEKSHYGNLDVWKSYENAWWNGMPDRGPANTRNQLVAPGTYYYVLDLGNGEVRKSFVFVSY
ncbi:MAG TPA: hypothetical protein DCL77_10770, partial [Prolixibacteraceae bacterium]|nr:hypothetical protein [Prolixibacteraceae bacterium]